MSVVSKRKSQSANETPATAPAISKKRKHDLSWLTNGLVGTEPFTVLQRFIQEVQDFKARVEGVGDTVQDFLNSGGTGQEFLDLLVVPDGTKRKATEIALIFNCLEAVLTRMATDLSEYRSVGMKTATSILQSHMIAIYMHLSPSTNANQVKSALRLLTSMVTLSHLTAREVITRFDFSHSAITHLLNRRSITDLPDVRSTYIVFITAFLMEDDSMILRTMGENPDILRPIFAGLIFDTVGTLQLFLGALRDKLVSSPLLSKTLKLHIFNAKIIQRLPDLFHWQGPLKAPRKTLKQDKSAETNVDDPEDEATEEEKMTVAELVQSLLILLSSSHKFGIAFVDHNLGITTKKTSSKNYVTFTLLESMGDFWDDPKEKLVELRSQIVIRAMQSCPDLMRTYLESLSTELGNVRESPAWRTLCSVVQRSIQAQNVTIVFHPWEKYTVKLTGQRATSLVAPAVLSRTFFSNSLSNSPSCQLAAVRILQTVLVKAAEFKHALDRSAKAQLYKAKEKSAIFRNFKDLVLKFLPSWKELVDCCTNLSSVEKPSDECIEYWIVLLDILYRYSAFDFIQSQETEIVPIIPIMKIVNQAMTCVTEASGNQEQKNLAERLQLGALTFASSMPVTLSEEADEQERSCLLSLLSRCLVDFERSPSLRQLTGNLLMKTLLRRPEGQMNIDLTALEFNVWITVIESHPKAASFFAQTCIDFDVSAQSFREEMEKKFEPLSAISPLIIASWKGYANLGASSEKESIAAYIRAVICELLLCQESNHQQLAAAFLKMTPEQLSTKPFKSFLQSWAEKGKKNQKQSVVDISHLGLSPLAAILYSVSSTKDKVSEDKAAELQSEWSQEVMRNTEWISRLQVALSQGFTCLKVAHSKDGDTLLVLSLIRLLLNTELAEDELEENTSTTYTLNDQFLQHRLTVEWFNPISLIDDPLIFNFNALVRNALKRVKDPLLDLRYQRSLVDCITRVVRGELTAVATVPDKEQEVTLSMSELKIEEIEPLIVEVTKQNSPTEVVLRYLDLLLQRVARLRLQGVDQRLSPSTLNQVAQLFSMLGAPVIFRQGLHDIISVCPESLLTLSSTHFNSVMTACLSSSTDCTDLCLLLVKYSPKMGAVLARWCLEHPEHFHDVNWRVQLLPAFFAMPDRDDSQASEVLTALHQHLSPTLARILTDRQEYVSVVAKHSQLSDLIRIVIRECWSPEECCEVAEKLLPMHKNGLKCGQFVDVGHYGGRMEIHLKLVIRTALPLLKNESGTDETEMKILADELAWLKMFSAKSESSAEQLAHSALADSVAWGKFLKHTLRVGLKALPATESTQPMLALRLLSNMWQLLLPGKPEEIQTTSQQVYEMVTSHSDFMSVMLDEEELYAEQKKLLLQLLTTLIRANPKLCQASHVPLLLASYGASRYKTDRLILELLRTYERNGVILSTYKPYLWGQAAAAHYSIQRGTSTLRLSQQPDASQILALLDSEKMLKTAFKFPIRLKLNERKDAEFQPDNDEDEDEEYGEGEYTGGDYDPRFLLSVLAHILAPEYALQCLKFTQSTAPCVLFASLSSSCGEMRSLGWLALGRFYDQLQNASVWPERCLWLHLIECLRLGAGEHFRERYGSMATRQFPPKLSNIITLFMAKAAAILRDPTHPMFRTVNNFLLVKPTLDVMQVPEFFVLLNSTELPDIRSQHRVFLFQLLRDGLRSRMDYLVCARRRVFRILLSLQPSTLLADHASKSLILDVVRSALRNPIVAYDLIINRGLVMWLDGLVLADKNGSTIGDPNQLLLVAETMWTTLEGHVQRKRCSRNKAEQEEELARLECELQEAEQDAPQPEIESGKRPALNNRKPIWDLLPSQEQVIAPWIVSELMQFLIHLWNPLNHAEVDSEAFERYTRVLCAVASHLHETKQKISLLPNKSLFFVAPSRMLSASLLDQLVEVSTRFVGDLPDLRDHFHEATLAASSTVINLKKVNPAESTRRAEVRHSSMKKMLDQQSDKNPSIRHHLHSLISLMECGI